VKPRDFANIFLDRFSRIGLTGRLAAQNVFGLTHGYQPDPFGKAPNQDPRACCSRFDAMNSILVNLVSPSILDVGCNQGYFTFRFAMKGGVCLGVDSDRGELMAARARAVLKNMRNVAFLEMTLNPDNMMSLPACDIVICQSIFHHWVRHYGVDDARKMLVLLASRAGKALVFDSGQPEEKETRWANCLAFMQPDGPEWIKQFLSGLGFVSIVDAGTFPTGVSSIFRTLFVALREKPSS
jgi:SAM-dependent methyltransferase